MPHLPLNVQGCNCGGCKRGTATLGDTVSHRKEKMPKVQDFLRRQALPESPELIAISDAIDITVMIQGQFIPAVNGGGGISGNLSLLIDFFGYVLKLVPRGLTDSTETGVKGGRGAARVDHLLAEIGND